MKTTLISARPMELPSWNPGSIMQLLGQVSADRIGINATDLNCLNLVALTGHMTAGDLAKQTGLSTASITGVLDRLEEGGFVRRVRDPHDRRRVIAELAGGPGLREVGHTFGPVVKSWRAAAADYSDDELRLLLEFQGKLEEIISLPGTAGGLCRVPVPATARENGVSCRLLPLLDPAPILAPAARYGAPAGG